jgi:hypothetical protein
MSSAELSAGLFIYSVKTCLRGKTPPRLGHLAPASEVTGHSGTISSKQLDIKNYFFPFFFVLYVDLKLSDDIFKKRKKMSPNGENWSMEKFENFWLQKWIFGDFAVFSTESVSNISDKIALHFKNALILYFHMK